ncbi:MAG: polymer-forming cytoskeletal protein [Nitrospiraceae bacterium]|nr:MAG: polymer-forming cytoskeletal protein [Nitrospiraceae bacterium]
MFKMWNSDSGSAVVNGNGDKTVKSNNAAAAGTAEGSENKASDIRPAATPKRTNMILKGSKLTGDINITSDLELSGDVDGNIRSFQDSNIVLKGNCKGNIETKDGSVTIEGSLEGGNIIAGKEVRITGKFNGGEIKAKNKIYIDGEFSGKLEAGEIEIGSRASGKGELRYREFISIARGAKVNVQVSQSQQEAKPVDKPREKETAETGPDSAIKS